MAYCHYVIERPDLSKVTLNVALKVYGKFVPKLRLSSKIQGRSGYRNHSYFYFRPYYSTTGLKQRNSIIALRKTTYYRKIIHDRLDREEIKQIGFERKIKRV
jgi:hypothetical protein